MTQFMVHTSVSSSLNGHDRESSTCSIPTMAKEGFEGNVNDDIDSNHDDHTNSDNAGSEELLVDHDDAMDIKQNNDINDDSDDNTTNNESCSTIESKTADHSDIPSVNCHDNTGVDHNKHRKQLFEMVDPTNEDEVNNEANFNNVNLGDDSHDRYDRPTTPSSLSAVAKDIGDALFSDSKTIDIPNFCTVPSDVPPCGSDVISPHREEQRRQQQQQNANPPNSSSSTTPISPPQDIPSQLRSSQMYSMSQKARKDFDRKRINLSRRLMGVAPNTAGLCVHPMTRTKEPYEIDITKSYSMTAESTDDDQTSYHTVVSSSSSLKTDRRKRRLGTPLLSAMDPTSSKIIGRPSALNLTKKAVSVGSAMTGSKPIRRMERYSYAKALLLSDDELERFSQKIRLEINESELFELAQAAEKAAAAGETQFRGRASTFGNVEKETSSTRNRHDLPLSTTASSNDNVGGTLEGTIDTKDTTHTQLTRPVALGQPVTFTPRRRTESEPHTSINGAVNLSLPESLKSPETPTSPFLWPEPEKRSMEVMALRNINEVIPGWRELHGHIRTHLYRESVNSQELCFAMDTSEQAVEQSTCNGFPSSLMITSRHHKSKSNMEQISRNDDEGAHEITHRRSRSWIDDIADIALPALGQGGVEGILDRSLVSMSDAATKARSVDEATEAETVTRESDTNCHPIDLDATDGEPQPLPSREPEIESQLDMPFPLIPTDSTLADKKNLVTSSSIEPSLPARLPKRKDVLELFDDSIASDQGTESDDRIQFVSTCSSNDSFCIVKDDDSNAGLWEISPSPNRHNTPAEDIGRPSTPHESSDSKLAAVSLFDADDESTCPASPLQESSLENFIYQSYPPMPTGPLIPQTPGVRKQSSPRYSRSESGFSTPAHLRVIKTLHRKMPSTGTSKASHMLPLPNSTRNIDHEPETATPVVSIGQMEPNSIVASPDDKMPIGSLSRRNEAEASYLALPAIESSVTEDAQNQIRSIQSPTKSSWVPQGKAMRPSRSAPNLIAGLDSSQGFDEDRIPLGKEKIEAAGSSLNSPHGEYAPIMLPDGSIDEKKECEDTLAAELDDPYSVLPAVDPNSSIIHDEPEVMLSRSSDLHDIHNVNSLLQDTTGTALVKVRGGEGYNSHSGTNSTSDVERSPIGRRWVGRGNSSMCHSFQEPDRNIKAVIQGVISHFSPKKKKKKRLVVDVHPAAENREYLNNYFYCSKSDLNDTPTTYPMDDDTESSTHASSLPIPPGRISWDDPCVGTQCNMFGVDAICNGFSFWFPRPGHGSHFNDDLSGSYRSDDPTKRTSLSGRMRSSSLGAVEWRSQELRSPPPGEQNEGWLGMLKGLGIDFKGEDDIPKKKIPFSPPGLARRFSR